MSNSPAYNVRYSLPNPIAGGAPPNAWMLSVSFLAVVSIADQAAFEAKTGTADLNAAFNKWVPVAAAMAQNNLFEAGMIYGTPENIAAHAGELADKTKGMVAKHSADWGLNVQDFKFEKMERPADEAERLRRMGLA